MLFSIVYLTWSLYIISLQHLNSVSLGSFQFYKLKPQSFLSIHHHDCYQVTMQIQLSHPSLYSWQCTFFCHCSQNLQSLTYCCYEIILRTSFQTETTTEILKVAQNLYNLTIQHIFQLKCKAPHSHQHKFSILYSFILVGIFSHTLLNVSAGH